MKMHCNEFTAALDDYLDDRLDPSARDACELHLRDCPQCSATTAQARRVIDALAVYPVTAPSDGFAERALERARTASRKRSPRKTPRLIAGGFIVAFAASIFTVIYTGLLVEAPNTELAAGLPSVAMSVDEDRIVNLVFTSATALDEVSLLVDLPEGVELVGYEGRRQVRWTTQLQSGRNVLPLELVARAPRSGQLVASLEHGEQRKVFRVYLDVSPG
jgi:anti-sigma factor RsiW